MNKIHIDSTSRPYSGNLRRLAKAQDDLDDARKYWEGLGDPQKSPGYDGSNPLSLDVRWHYGSVATGYDSLQKAVQKLIIQKFPDLVEQAFELLELEERQARSALDGK